MHEFVEKQIDHVELTYHHFKSMGSQVLLRENYLPIDLTQVAQEAAEDVPEDARSFNNDYIVEPSVGELIAELLPKVLSQKIFTCFSIPILRNMLPVCLPCRRDR